MSDIKVIEVETRKENIEKFTLLNEDNNKCFIILDRVKQKSTFEYLMDCMRDECVVDRNKLFVKKQKEVKK